MSKLERDLYLPLYRGANLEGWGLYRIGDGAWGMKPCDIGGSGPNGECVVLEVKVVEQSPSPDKPLPWRQFSDHQLNWLEFVAARPWALSLVGLYVESTKEMRIYQVVAPEFLDEPAKHFPCVTLTHDGNVYRGWKEIIKARDRRSLSDALGRI